MCSVRYDPANIARSTVTVRRNYDDWPALAIGGDRRVTRSQTGGGATAASRPLFPARPDAAQPGNQVGASAECGDPETGRPVGDERQYQPEPRLGYGQQYRKRDTV